jgi:uncharacterized protein (DUF58 family)
VGLGAGLLLLAVVLRRADLVVLGAPFAFGAVVGLSRRPRGLPGVRLQVPAHALLEEERLDAVVTVAGTDAVDVASVVLLVPQWLVPEVGSASRAVTVGAGEEVDLAFRLRCQRWGRRHLGPAVLRATAAHGMLRCGPLASGAGLVATWPLREEFVATDAVPRAAGLVGLHHSRRLGEGTDVAGVRPFLPGDRLHRVNWRVTQRTDRLHVTSTYSDRDAEVLLVLDSRQDLGRPPVSCLDTGVRAAAAIAEHYLREGDRVGLLDLGQYLRFVRAGNGRTHLARIVDVLLDVRPLLWHELSDRAATQLTMGNLPAEVSTGTLVVVLGPLAGEAAFRLLASLARAGRSVVAVDTLPPDARPEPPGLWSDLAYRVWRLEREGDIVRLGDIGVPVVRWLGAGSLDQVLRDVSRAARAPRLRR